VALESAGIAREDGLVAAAMLQMLAGTRPSLTMPAPRLVARESSRLRGQGSGRQTASTLGGAERGPGLDFATGLH
jgi:hypothetical protein